MDVFAGAEREEGMRGVVADFGFDGDDLCAGEELFLRNHRGAELDADFAAGGRGIADADEIPIGRFHGELDLGSAVGVSGAEKTERDARRRGGGAEGARRSERSGRGGCGGRDEIAALHGEMGVGARLRAMGGGGGGAKRGGVEIACQRAPTGGRVCGRCRKRFFAPWRRGVSG